MPRVPTLVVEPTETREDPARPGRSIGVLVGRSEPTCRLEFVPWTTRLEVGMHLVTSGFGGEIPPGLVCGRIAAVENDESAPFLEVEVEPAVEIDRLTQVLVVRRQVVRPESQAEED